MTPLALLFVAIGGACGATLRYVTTEVAAMLLGRAWTPAATLAVNLVGCLLIGLVAARAGRNVDPAWLIDNKPLVAAGFCGGLTTFSTFGLETFKLLETRPLAAIGLVAAHVVLGVTAVWLGGRLA